MAPMSVFPWRLTKLLACCLFQGLGHLSLVVGHELQPSVAVIGAGIGGSTASYFLRELLGNEVEIVVFDTALKAGGRTDVSLTRAMICCCVVTDEVVCRSVLHHDKIHGGC